MSKHDVETLLEAGGQDKSVQAKYDSVQTKEEFVKLAATDGYNFTVEELDAVLRETGDTFELYGNPPQTRHLVDVRRNSFARSIAHQVGEIGSRFCLTGLLRPVLEANGIRPNLPE